MATFVSMNPSQGIILAPCFFFYVEHRDCINIREYGVHFVILMVGNEMPILVDNINIMIGLQISN